MFELLSNEIFHFYSLLVLCLVMMYIPYIGKYVRLISTMIHEGGHVLMGLLMGEKTLKVNLFNDASGEAAISISNKFKKLMIALAGYPSTALAAFLSFWLISKGYNYYYVIGLSVLTLVFLVFYIRNAFGICWSISFIILNAVLVYYQQIQAIELLAHIYASIIFLESIFSCFILTYVSFKSPKTLSDAGSIASVIYVPKQLIALLLTTLNIYIAYLSVIYFFPRILLN